MTTHGFLLEVLHTFTVLGSVSNFVLVVSLVLESLFDYCGLHLLQFLSQLLYLCFQTLVHLSSLIVLHKHFLDLDNCRT
jgi:hypothetical protein